MSTARRAICVLLISAVAGAACGGSGEQAAPTTAAAPTESTVAPDPGTAPVAAGNFGDLVGVCGPGSAKGATAQGVTDSQIEVGTVSDPGNSIIPGLNQELFDAADAFVGWCNGAGGILGRTIKLNKRDAKLMEAGPRTVEACQTDFMLVGNGAALDDTTVKPRTECGLAEIAAYTVSTRAGRAADSILAIVNSDYQSHLTGIYRQILAKDPAAVAFFGELNSQLPALNTSGKRNAQAAVDLGFTQVYYEETPMAVDNWRTYAENIKKAGVQVLAMEDTPENTASLLRAFSDTGYFPKYLVMEANHYNAKFVDEAGAVLDQTVVLINTGQVPFELSGPDYPATQQLIGLLEQYAQAEPQALAINAFSAWLLWAVSAKACGDNLTRACVMGKASSTTIWTAGGLHAPETPGNGGGTDSACFLALQATSKGFVVNSGFTNATEGLFNCDPKNVATVTGFAP